MVGRGEVEIDAAERAICFGLAQDDGDDFIQRDAVAEVWPAVLVSLDRLFHKGEKRAFAFLRRLIEAHDVLLERLEGFSDFRLKGLNGHGEIVISS